MLDKNKFTSSMQVLLYIFNKYKTDELRKYCFERFYHTPLNIRSDAELLAKGDKLIFKEPHNHAFIRIDDVCEKDQILSKILKFTTGNSIPVNLQVIPKLLKEELAVFLKKIKNRYPDLISINQHGYAHKNRNPDKWPKYEFGSSISYKTQKTDIAQGSAILSTYFGKQFTKIFSHPFHGYDVNTLKALNKLDFNLISLKDNINFNNRTLFDLPINFDLIKKYNPDIFYGKKELFNRIRYISGNKRYLGILLHPQRMNFEELNKFKELVKFAKLEGSMFDLMENIAEDLFIKRNRIYVDKSYKTFIDVGLNFERLEKEIENFKGLTNEITFNLK